jgi:hypothetical protein
LSSPEGKSEVKPLVSSHIGIIDMCGEFGVDDMLEAGLFGAAGDAKAESNSKESGLSRLTKTEWAC